MFAATFLDKLAAFPAARITIAARDGSTRVKTFADLRQDVAQLIAQLHACGIRSRELVGVLGDNSYEWVVADIALLAAGCIPVALPAELLKEAPLAEVVERYGMVATLVTHLAADVPVPPSVGVLDRGALSLRKRAADVAPPSISDEVCTIVFSSGTSGRRKGLRLTFAGIDNTIRLSKDLWRVAPGDNVLIVMPFSNFQQRYLLYTSITCGSDVSIVAPERVFQRMRDLESTIVVGPPSFFELVENRLRREPWLQRLPLMIATGLQLVSPRWRGWRLRRRLCTRWTRMYGERVRLMFVGSAPVRSAMVELYHRLGLPLFEAYGLTEVGWIAFSLPGACRLGSAGRLVPGLEVALGDDGEVRVRSSAPQADGYVFEGIDEQEAVFLGDGSIATGDVARLDAGDFLTLTGRVKNVIVTRSGVKINPEDIERDIEDACAITKAVIMPDPRRPMLACGVWLDDWESAERRRAIVEAVAAINARRSASHHIGDVIFRPASELTNQNGMMTRNQKVNRAVIMAHVLAQDAAAS